ncbi:transcriptional regulator BetI [Variovorax sp. PBL-H6]|uniref:TetR/AcrR family transcriptional regulator n=1 Tax=Variovorax sp. PBL-H6 TaxID=434009 RepID=UPI0013172878|nr:TetR/AcrR family transcriptional regulator [Variovorax sp. PBL-H6]VTU39652.1 transcriptional regulator BetI [Variovorax sp. PBL-H6]
MAKPLVPARPRRTQAERTMSTQRKLIDGAIDLLKKKRYASFRTADVAEQAGVSKGAQTHHFPSKDMLVLQALEEVYRRTQQRALERIAVGRSAPGTLLEQLVSDSREFFLGDDFLLSLDLMMVDPSSTLGSDVKRLAQLYRLPVEQAWLDALVAAGHPERQAKDVVRLTFAIARGFGVRQLIAGQDEEFQHLMDSWMRMAEAMLLLSSGPRASDTQSRRPLGAPKRTARKNNAA